MVSAILSTVMVPVRRQAHKIYLPSEPLEYLTWESLWALHEKGLSAYRSRDTQVQGISWLHIKQVLAERMLEHCRYCSHLCNVNRKIGQMGYCQLDANAIISGEYIHYGEESGISPTHAIFFSGCTMHCVYCHNWRETFQPRRGKAMDSAMLVEAIIARQQQQTPQTISFIGGTPEPNLHTIIALARQLPATIWQPLVFNSNATLSTEGLALMEGIIDIYLPDFRHGNDHCAWELTHIQNYVKTVTDNLLTYAQQRSRTLVRHLVIPNHLECCTRPVLEWLAHHLPTTEVNIMFQYRPFYRANDRHDINRSLNKTEKETVSRWADELKLRCVN